jgi:site-specific recombinase XerD
VAGGQKKLVETEKLSARVQSLVEASLAENTHRTYGSAIRLFHTWCAKKNSEAVPATAEVVAEYIASLVASGKRGSSIKTHAIAHLHKSNGHCTPTDSYLVRAVLRGSMRLRGSFVDQKLPVVVADFKDVLQRIPDTLKGRRDRAILALCFAGALRRSEVAALRIEDLTFSDQGVSICIRKSKTDFQGRGVHIGVPNGRTLQVVSALKDWLDAANITKGAIFRPVYRNRVLARAVEPVLVSRVLKAYLNMAGIDPGRYGAHSLRAGFITSAAEAGVSLDRIMDHSRHVEPRHVRGYVRRANLFRDHPGDAFL